MRLKQSRHTITTSHVMSCHVMSYFSDFLSVHIVAQKKNSKRHMLLMQTYVSDGL